VRGPEGETRTLTSYERPAVPVVIELGGGVGFQSDVDLLNVDLSFGVRREPGPELRGVDPLEIRFGVAYSYGRSKREVVNDQLQANFGVDLNLVAPRTTPFLFVNVARNPVFNQNIDVLAAPVGVKFDLMPREVMKLDFSLAPVLNYRAIRVEGEVSDVFKVRASARFRVGWSDDRFSVWDTVEYLPTLTRDPARPLTLGQRFSEDAIVRNTFGFSVAIQEWLSLRNELVFTQDPTLVAQADCAGGATTLLCDGRVVTQRSELVLSWGVRR